MENLIIFQNNSESCYIKPREPNFPSGLHLNYSSCPEQYDNSTKKLVLHCCLKLILSFLDNSSVGTLQHWLAYYSSSIFVLPAVFLNLLWSAVFSEQSKRYMSLKVFCKLPAELKPFQNTQNGASSSMDNCKSP